MDFQPPEDTTWTDKWNARCNARLLSDLELHPVPSTTSRMLNNMEFWAATVAERTSDLVMWGEVVAARVIG